MVSQSCVSEKGVCRRRTPHSGKDLSKTADENSHADNGVRDSDTASIDVVHGKDEGGAGEGEQTTASCPVSKPWVLPRN